MSNCNDQPAVTRRNVLKAGAATAALAAASSVLNAAEPTATAPASQQAALPTRPLGRSSIPVSILNMGCGGAITQRLLGHAYDCGIRYLDTAASYGKGKSEQEIARWLEASGKRKEIFLVTKDELYDGFDSIPGLVNKRLEALKTDYIDVFFIHGLSTKSYGDEAMGWFKDAELKAVAEKLKKSGKIRLFGFSVHEANTHEYLSAAAEGGFADAVMLGYNPVLGDKADKLNRAMDACHKAGIGLVAMKTMRGIGDQLKKGDLAGVPLPAAVIHAVLSDERIASVCSEMKNFVHMDQNVQAVRSFRKPPTAAQRDALRETLLAGGMAYCPGCDACADAASHAHDVARHLSYCEQDGRRSHARELYHALPPEARQADAAVPGCACRVDYAAITRRAAERLA